MGGVSSRIGLSSPVIPKQSDVTVLWVLFMSVRFCCKICSPTSRGSRFLATLPLMLSWYSCWSSVGCQPARALRLRLPATGLSDDDFSPAFCKSGVFNTFYSSGVKNSVETILTKSLNFLDFYFLIY